MARKQSRSFDHKLHDWQHRSTCIPGSEASIQISQVLRRSGLSDSFAFCELLSAEDHQDFAFADDQHAQVPLIAEQFTAQHQRRLI